MATLKHINSKNADYGAAEQYLLFEHDEFTMKPVLDETGRLIPVSYTHLDVYKRQIWYEAPEHEKNFTTLLELINASEAREDDETFKNPVDLMFDELEERRCV